MGWDICSSWRSKADVVAEQVREGRFGPGSRPLAVKKTSDGYWILWQASDAERAQNFHNKFIECGLVKWSAQGYALKWMTAAEGPYLYDCPADWLDDRTEFSPTWAEKVRARASSLNKPDRYVAIAYPRLVPDTSKQRLSNEAQP